MSSSSPPTYPNMVTPGFKPTWWLRPLFDKQPFSLTWWPLSEVSWCRSSLIEDLDSWNNFKEQTHSWRSNSIVTSTGSKSFGSIRIWSDRKWAFLCQQETVRFIFIVPSIASLRCVCEQVSVPRRDEGDWAEEFLNASRGWVENKQRSALICC